MLEPTGHAVPRAIAITGPAAVVLIDESAGLTIIRDLQGAVSAERPFDAVVEIIVRAGVAELPSVAVAVREGPAARLLIRGRMVATICAAAKDEEQFDGRGVTTWIEHVIPNVTLVRLSDETSVSIVVVFSAPAPGTHPVNPISTDEPCELSEHREEVSAPVENLILATEHVQLDQPVLVTDTVSYEEDLGVAVQSSLDDQEFDFVHLLEETSYRGVEAAAVRVNEADEWASPRQVDPDSDPDPPVPIAPVRHADGGIHFRSDPSNVAVRSPAVLPPPTRPSAPMPAHGNALIDSVPIADARPQGPTPHPSLDSTPQRPQADGESHFGEHNIEDHDGLTIGVVSLQKAQMMGLAGRSASPQVQAVHCPAGHPNPPHAAHCRSCRAVVSDRSVVSVARPSLGLLRFDDGMVVELDSPLLLGRKPIRGAPTDAMMADARLIAIPDPGKALSRVHLAIRLRDWQVVVVDCDSVNHTFVELPGQIPQQLRPSEEFVITPGTRVNLGSVATFVFEADVG